MATDPSATSGRPPQAVRADLWLFAPNRDSQGGSSWWLQRPLPDGACGVLIDCPALSEANLSFLRQRGPGWIVLTGREGHGRCRRLQEALGWPVWVQEQEAYLLPGSSSWRRASSSGPPAPAQAQRCCRSSATVSICCSAAGCCCLLLPVGWRHYRRPAPFTGRGNGLRWIGCASGFLSARQPGSLAAQGLVPCAGRCWSQRGLPCCRGSPRPDRRRRDGPCSGQNHCSAQFPGCSPGWPPIPLARSLLAERIH